ncbi:hypothetical protein MNB_SM-4-1159 [hydrothermal vent metagenome]|uniref:Novel toxin 15 domain-containing protein n=1 Tax=hydrothermal vent metagenome TaxID=652676 RepID=A0A1W1CFD3_9ZZZZ
MAADGLNDLRLIEDELSKAMDNYNILDTQEKDCKEREQKRASAQKTGEGGNKVKGNPGKLKKKKVKCFCPGDHDKGGRDEYDKQLKHQQDGINNTSVDDYIKNRKEVTGKNICGDLDKKGKYAEDTKEGIIERKGSVTSKATTEWKKKLRTTYKKEFRKKGYSPRKAASLTETKINRDIRGAIGTQKISKKTKQPIFKKDGSKDMHYSNGQNALHNQDRVAGGFDRVGTVGENGKTTYSAKDFGTADVNQEVGRSWNYNIEENGKKTTRAMSMDKEACKAEKNEDGKEKMNVELRACGKKEAKKNGCHKK